MAWKEKGYNMYPNIILSDCKISKIQVINKGLVFRFSDYGFVKKDTDGKYYRTDGAELVAEGFDREDFSVREIRMLLNGEFFCLTSYTK